MLKKLKRYSCVLVTIVSILLAVLQVNVAYATATTFYPDAHTEVTSVDGGIGRSGVSESWATITSGTGTAVNSNASNIQLAYIKATTTTDQWYSISRAIFLFDTSPLPDSCIITGATLELPGAGKAANFGFVNFKIGIVSSNPATNTDLVIGDYSTLGTTALSNYITYEAWNTHVTEHNVFTLNATGIAAISKIGVSKFGVREMTYDATGISPTWSAGYYQYINCGSADRGTSQTRPRLVVTYTALVTPVITTNAATNTLGTSADLNGNITSDGGATVDNYGFVWDTTSRTDPGNTAPAASAYLNNYTAGAGIYSTTPFVAVPTTYHVTGIVAGTTYFVRAAAHNTNGWAYGSEITFRTLDLPAGDTIAASEVTTTGARLNGQVTSWGGQLCDARFAYDTVAHALFADYATITAWVNDTYDNDTNSTPYVDITGLTSNTTYHYRVQLRNDAGSTTGSDITFKTESNVVKPTNFTAISLATSISLAWTKTSGADYTVIRYSSAGYPTVYTDGSPAYLGTGNSVAVSGLTAGTTYYFAAWGMTEGVYSASSATVLSTTVAYDVPPTSGGGIEVPKADSSFTQTPDTSKVSRIPLIGGLIEVDATAYGIPLNMLWYFLWVMGSVGLGIFVYNKSERYNLPIALGTTAVCFGLGAVVGLVMLWILMAFAIIGAGFSMWGLRY